MSKIGTSNPVRVMNVVWIFICLMSSSVRSDTHGTTRVWNLLP